MTFQTATQATDLDRADYIGSACAAARENRARYEWDGADNATLARVAQGGSEAAALELIARHEPRIRAVVSECRVANGAAETDLHQAALLGFLNAVQEYRPDACAEFFTFAHPRVRLALTEANRCASPVPVASNLHKRFFAAMRAADSDPYAARRWTQLQRLSIAALEIVADSGGMDARLAREIVDRRVDVYEGHVTRGYVGTGRGKGARKPVPAWDEYREQRGRGLTGPEFDTILAAVTYSSLSAPVAEDDADDRDTDGDPITADPEADPFADVENGVAFWQMFRALDDREQKVIRRHLDGDTDREIATALGLSRPRVVTIRSTAVARMRRLAAG